MNKLFSVTLRAFLLAGLVVLGGCFSPGPLKAISVQGVNGEVVGTIYAHDQQLPDYLIAKDQLALNFIVPGEATPDQLKAIANTESACRIYTKTVRPNDLVAVGLDSVLYFGAGFLGGGAGINAFDHTGGVAFVEYGKDTGAISGMGGMANGIISLGGKKYTFDRCGSGVIATLFRKYKITVIETGAVY